MHKVFYVCLGLMALPASAQDAPQGVSLGIGLAAANGYLIGEDTQALALPILRYDSAAFSVGFPDGLRMTVFENEALRFSAVVTPRLSAIALSDAAELDGIDRALTADGGVQLDVNLAASRTRLTLRAVGELTDEHRGQEVSLGVTQALPVGGMPVLLGAGLSWQSTELTSYLYGVGTDEATPGRAAYAPGDVVIPYVSIGTMVPVSDHVRLVANLKAEFLPDAVSKSPIIDEDVSVGAFLGLSFSF